MTVGARCGVERPNRMSATWVPSGLIRPASCSVSAASASTVTSRDATSMRTVQNRLSPAASGTTQVATTVLPSGLTSQVASSWTRPGTWPVRSVSSSRGSACAASAETSAGAAVNSRGDAGPRSWSQYRTG